LHRIYFTGDALADVKRLPKNVRNALKAQLTGEFSRDPKRRSLELRDRLAGFRSLHWKNYRVVFKILDEERAIVVFAVDDRGARAKANIYSRLSATAEQGKLAERLLATLRGFTGKGGR